MWEAWLLGNLTRLQLETLRGHKCHMCPFSLETITAQSSKGNGCCLACESLASLYSRSAPSAWIAPSVGILSTRVAAAAQFKFCSFLLSERKDPHCPINTKRTTTSLWLQAKAERKRAVSFTTGLNMNCEHLGEVTCNRRDFDMEILGTKAFDIIWVIWVTIPTYTGPISQAGSLMSRWSLLSMIFV